MTLLIDPGGENQRLNAQQRALTTRHFELNAWAAVLAEHPADAGPESDVLAAILGHEYVLLYAEYAVVDAARHILDEQMRRYDLDDEEHDHA